MNAAYGEAASGQQRMTNFPFYYSGNYHWGVRGNGNRWECDDHPNGPGNTTLHQVWVRDNTQRRTTDYASCTAIQFAGLSRGDGVYDTSGGQVYCDMTTDGGGWTLALAYQHTGGQNAELVSGRAPLSPSAGYSHLSNAVMNQMPWTELRLSCRTSGHPRVVDFKTSSAGAVRYFKGIAANASTYWSSGFTALGAHTAYLPAAANSGFTQDATLDDRLTNFPFYLGGTYHWGVRGLGNRWACDDFPGGPGNTTNHQVWVRDQAARLCADGVQDQGETGVDCGGPCANVCAGSCAAQGAYASCAAVPSGCSSGVYTLTSGATTFEGYCDLTTAGGGWLLALAYDHVGGDNRGLVPGTAPRDPNGA